MEVISLGIIHLWIRHRYNKHPDFQMDLFHIFREKGNLTLSVTEMYKVFFQLIFNNLFQYNEKGRRITNLK